MSYESRAFVGSSSAGKSIALALESALDGRMLCQLWFKGPSSFSGTIIEDLESIARSEVDCAILILTPDDLRDRGEGLQESPRDNVLFELGLFMGALGRGRTFGLKCRHCLIDLPSDLHGVRWVEYSHPHERGQLPADPAEQLDGLRLALAGAAEQIVAQVSQLKPEPVRAGGALELVKAYPMRGLVTRPEWNGIIQGVVRHLWLYGMAEHGYAEDDAVPAIMQEASDRNCDLRILLLNPDYAGTGGIDIDEGNPPGTLVSRIRASLARFSQMKQAGAYRLQLRVYDFPPATSVVRGDDRMLVTPYVRFLAGSNSPTLELRHTEPGMMFERYTRHFNKVWHLAKDWIE